MTYSPLRELATHPGQLRIAYTHMPQRLGQYYADQRKIVLHDALTPAQERVVLTHELRHAELGHDDTATGLLDDLQEQEAHLATARLLIRIDDLLAALEHASTAEDVAQMLGVTPEVVRWRMLSLRGLDYQMVRARVQASAERRLPTPRRAVEDNVTRLDTFRAIADQ